MEGVLEKALDLFRFKPLGGHYHVNQGTDAHNEIKYRDTSPETIGPPFLPSIASNGIDVGGNGGDFAKASRFNPDSVNAAILAPTIYAYIMSAHLDKDMSQVLLEGSRKEHVNYYLRFHNSHGDSGTIKKVHTAYQEHHQQTYDKGGSSICHKSTPMLGMLDFVITTFNAYLSVEAETVIDEGWDVRTAHFKKMGRGFSTVFTNIGTTSAGRDPPLVIQVLGKRFCHQSIYSIL